LGKQGHSFTKKFDNREYTYLVRKYYYIAQPGGEILMNFQNAEVITKKKIQEIEQVCRQCDCACPVDEDKE